MKKCDTTLSIVPHNCLVFLTHPVRKAIKNGCWNLSSTRFYLVYFSELLHLLLYNRYWLSGFSIFLVQLWNKNRFFIPYFYGNTFKELFAKVRTIFETQGSYDVFISTLDGRLSGCSPYPIHPEFITSFRDTPRLISECQSFEKSYGFLNMVSGHQVVWLHHFEKLRQVPECRCGSTGCIGVHRWGQWSLVGWWWFGMGGYFEVVGDGGKVGLLFISQTVSSIFGGCLWPGRSGSGHDEGKVRPSTVQSHPRTALDNLL